MTAGQLTLFAALGALALSAAAATADTVVATRVIRAQEVVMPSDVATDDTVVDGAFAHPRDVIGLEARVTIYTGRPIMYGQVGPAAIVERNEIVPIVFRRGGLTITSEGRALERAGVGDRIRIMSLSSRSTVTGTVQQDATVLMDGSMTQNR